MSLTRVEQDFFVAGGTLRADAPSYVVRPADEQLFQMLMAGEYCHVLTCRQMGKSSLMIQAQHRLRERGIKTATVDLSYMNADKPDTWYLNILTELADAKKLALNVNVESWWHGQSLGYPKRFVDFMNRVVLAEIKDPVVIFVDEIDSTLKLDFTDDFFVAIRAMYNKRAEEGGRGSAFNRLTFVLLGVATPSELIKNRNITPYNVGERVELQEFIPSEAYKLQRKLQQIYSQQGIQIFKRIFFWTNGHPYLTQKICKEITESTKENWDNDLIDALVERLFLSEEAKHETNLQFIRDKIDNNPEKQRLLNLYRRIRTGENIREDERSLAQNQLKLYGLLGVKKRRLVVRNEIYHRVFNREWITSSQILKSADISDFGPYELFQSGGTLTSDFYSYVKRPADEELFRGVVSGEMCYVLATRQMGKSSMMIRAATRLQQESIRTAIMDLTKLGGDATAEQWYLGFLIYMVRELELEETVNVEFWWRENEALSPVQRFSDFLRDVVLIEIEEKVAIFIDEIDTTLRLDFSDDFFAAIRAMYNARATEPIFERLTFVLIGVATPVDLMGDNRRTPFNIGRKIDLLPFELTDKENLSGLIEGLNNFYSNEGEFILNHIFYWTDGHPYLTQKLCLSISEKSNVKKNYWRQEEIDNIVRKEFFSEMGRADVNFQFISAKILSHERKDRLLTLYNRIYQGEEITDDKGSILYSQLKLSGLVRAEDGYLRINNRIYRHVFSPEWIKENTSTSISRLLGNRVMVLLIVTLFVLVGVFSLNLWQKKLKTAEEIVYALKVSFHDNEDEVSELDSLNQLFRLGRYGDEARSLFAELPFEDKLTLFTSEPAVTPDQLGTVVGGIYITLANTKENNLLLEAMQDALGDSDDAESVLLKNEIARWLDGREAFSEGDFEAAITAYSTAIDLNGQNPAVYFDRALAHAAQTNYAQALADFEAALTLNLDEDVLILWEQRVRQGVITDAALYTYWQKQNTEDDSLLPIIPTPTAKSNGI